MSLTVKITNFNKLIEFIEAYQLNSEQIKSLLACSIHLYLDDPLPPKKKLISQLKDYWSKYGNQAEKPLFLN